MKLATLNDGTRDGQLVVVSRDLTRCAPADDIAPTLQAALDEWERLAPQLLSFSKDLEEGSAQDRPFDQAAAHSPLPRAYQWADGSAYVNHVALVRQARGAEMPDSFWTDPLMYQGGSDDFLPPRAPIPIPDEAWGIDMEAEVAVITDDVPMGVAEGDAAAHIKLVMLVNDVSLRNLIPAELGKGFGFFQSKPSTAFSPVAVTPDELGDAWKGCVLHRVMEVDLNGQPLGRADAGTDATFSLAKLVSHAAKSRNLRAGAIIGSGTVSNRDSDGGPGRPVADGGKGYSCLAEIRMVETIRDGSPSTPFMRFGDRVGIEMHDDDGASIFGRIDQIVEQYHG
ncbi:MAG: fumarylacetoacetate hydrolase family protein [Pseudomonadota bacterium]|nr:fumarylacetoacetate hydrolase family protein [Pseudomonadota bacterium]MEC8146126.1 fumarylacetoacetate hydrolase family protein [Pseudomonadota bacterium]MEC8549974.1 fumarylacetoacetate hydrolase family protein [Pseudomonadota bacterium]